MNQKKAFRLLLVLLLSALCLTTLIACGENNTVPETIYHTVSFDSTGGSQVAPQQVEAGKLAQKPLDPVKEGFVFGGWKNGVLDFVFDANKITQPISLSASWLSAEDAFSFEVIQETEEAILTGVNRELNLDVLALPSVLRGFTVTKIADEAFASLSSEMIRSVTVPPSITSVGKGAFANCADIPITLGGPLQEIGEEAFRGCNQLTAISFSEGMDSIPFASFLGCSSIRSLVIPDSVRVISENAFEDCSGIVYTVLPATLERVEDSAFDNCKIKNVFCKGNNTDLAPVIGSKNDSLTEANRYFYSEAPAGGNAWYFDANGVPKIH